MLSQVLQHVVESRISRLTRSSGCGGYRRKSREPQAESGVRRAWLKEGVGDNFCLIFQCNDCLALRTVLCFTPKQQSLHWKQQSPPTTHQLGEPLLCFSVYIFFTDQILQLVRQPRRWKNERVDETGRFESGLHPLTLLRPIFHTEHVRKRRPRLGHSVGRTAHEGRSLVSPFIRHVGDRSVPALDRRASARQGGAVRRAQP